MKFRHSLDDLGNDMHLLLKQSKTAFKPHFPDTYLYKRVVALARNDGFLSEDHIELVYVTLISWGMNQRSAKLVSYEDFERSVRENEGDIRILKDLKLELLSDVAFEEQLKVQGDLFRSMAISDPNKPAFVSFSKAMHFMLPDLIVPMDRKYTLSFFGGEGRVSTGGFDLYRDIFRKYWLYATEHSELRNYLDTDWTLSVPKLLDNLVIGYRKLKERNAEVIPHPV
jgi:hypothetical protein